MNSSMEEDYNIQRLSLTVAVGISFLTGLMVNGFIVAVNITDWMKRSPITATDQILTSLGIARMFCLSASLFDFFSQVLLINVPIIFYIIVENIWNIFFYTGILLSTLLSVVYCLKISNFHNDFFLRMKIIILQRVAHLIIACFLGSICYNSLFYMPTSFEFPKNSTNEEFKQGNDELRLYIFLLGNIVPFLIFFISSFLLIISLCHHMYGMRHDRTVTGHLDTYYKTIRFLTFSSFSYVLFLIAILTLGLYQTSIDILGFDFIFNAFPTLNSIYMIYVTIKLRTRFSGIIHHGISCLFNRKHS
ncbi:taste receptor type 2 member 43-like [Pseudophryne corroboree]|uniref:taste receptor type 2 member 43-like n=1 Tax=Pseudophryne corroboree TaxID=495146 RepID=UPI003081997D